MPVETIDSVLTVGLFLLAFVDLVAMFLYFRYLRLHHDGVYGELGSPSLILNASFRNQQAVNRFIWRNEYRELGDPGLDRFSVLMKVLGATTLVWFVSACSLFFVKVL